MDVYTQTHTETVKGCLNGAKDTNIAIQETGYMMKSMGKGKEFGRQGKYITATGCMIKWREKAAIGGQMARNIMVNLCR